MHNLTDLIVSFVGFSDGLVGIGEYVRIEFNRV